MNESCSISVSKKINDSEITIAEAEKLPINKGTILIAKHVQGILNDNYDERTKDSSKKTSIKELITRGVNQVRQLKGGAMDAEFVAIKNGKDEIVRHSKLKTKVINENNNMNEIVRNVGNLVNSSYEVFPIGIDGKLDTTAKKIDLSDEKAQHMGNFLSQRMIAELDFKTKKLYFREPFENLLYNTEAYLQEKGYSSKDIAEMSKEVDTIRELVEAQVSLEMQIHKESKVANIYNTKKHDLAIKKQGTEEHKDKSFKLIKKEMTFDELDAIQKEAENEYVAVASELNAVKERIKDNAISFQYQQHIKYTLIPFFNSFVKDDPQIQQAMEQRLKYQEEVRKKNLEAQARIGNDVSALDKYSYYFKIIVQDLDKGRKTKGATHSAMGLDLSMFVNQKGSTHEIMTNPRISDYYFHAAMAKNIHNAELKEMLQETNIVQEVADEIQQQINLSAIDLNERLLNTEATLSQMEIDNLNEIIYKFNSKIAKKYPELTITNEDIRSARPSRNAKGETDNVSINKEIANNIEIAIETEKNNLKNNFESEMYKDFFDNNRTFNDVKRYFEGSKENIETSRIVAFSDTVNAGNDINVDKLATLSVSDLFGMKNMLNTTILDNTKNAVGKIITSKLSFEDGTERYVLTDQNGNRLNPLEDMKIGSLSMEDMDSTNPTTFAEWLAKSMFINADINNTTEFLKKDKVMIIPSPVVKVLDDIKTNLNKEQTNPMIQGLKTATTLSKAGMLFNPLRVMSYNARNAIFDTYATLQSQPQVFLDLAKDLMNKSTDEHTNIFADFKNLLFNGEVSDELLEFMSNSETFMPVVKEEIFDMFNFNDKKTANSAKKELEAIEKGFSERLGTELGDKRIATLAKGYKAFTGMMKWWMNHATDASQARELFLRYAVYKSKSKEFMKSYEKNGAAYTENYGASKKIIIDELLKTANNLPQDTDEQMVKKMKHYREAAMEYANQSLVSYKDSSKFVDKISQWGVPFARFTEGNIRLHYRLMENFVYGMADAVRTGNLSLGLKTLGKGSLQLGNAIGIPVLAWNLAMLAMAGMDMDDIPEYYKDDGFFMIPPVLKLFGYEQSLMLGNSDGVSEMMSIIGMDDLNSNIQDVVYKNFSAMFDEDKDMNIVNDLYDAITGSYDGIWQNFVESPYQKAVSMGNPLIKFLPELISGTDYFPEGPVSVGFKYSLGENAFRKTLAAVGLSNLYTLGEEIAGTPRGMDGFELLGIKSIGTKQDAWTNQRSLAYDYGEKVLGKEPFSRDLYGDEVDYMRDDIANKLKYGDYEEVQQAIIDYTEYMKVNTNSTAELNTEMNSLISSLQNKFDVIPSTAISKSEMQGYIDTLSEAQINDLMLAYEYQRDILGPYYNFIYGN